MIYIAHVRFKYFKSVFIYNSRVQYYIKLLSNFVNEGWLIHLGTE